MKDHEELWEKAERSVERLNARHVERGVTSGQVPYAFQKEIVDATGKVVRTVRRGERYMRSADDGWRWRLGDPVEVATARQIFAWAEQKRLGARAIAGRLNDDGVPGPAGGPWGSRRVFSLLRNPLYAGGVSYFRRESGLFKTLRAGKPVTVARPGERRQEHMKPREEWVIRWDQHEGVVSREAWERVQAILDSRRESRANQHSLRSPRLTGPATCENCGSAMVGRGARGERYKLLCTGYATKGRAVCTRNPVDDQRLASLVWQTVGEDVRSLLGTTDLGERVRARVREILLERAKANAPAGDPSAARTRLRAIEESVRTIVTKLSPESAALLDGELRRLALEKAELERGLAASRVPSRDVAADVAAAMERLAVLDRPLDEVPPERARELLRATCRRVRLRFRRVARGKREISVLDRVALEVLDPRELLSVRAPISWVG